jgi:hypothetical protein
MYTSATLLLLKGPKMAQEKPAVTTVVQSRLLNIIDAVKRAKQQDGIWLTEHAVHKDLRLLADKIEQLAKTPDAH